MCQGFHDLINEPAESHAVVLASRRCLMNVDDVFVSWEEEWDLRIRNDVLICFNEILFIIYIYILYYYDLLCSTLDTQYNLKEILAINVKQP